MSVLTRSMIMRGMREITIEVINPDGSYQTPIKCDHIKSDNLQEEAASDFQPGGDRRLDSYYKPLGLSGSLVFGKMDLAAKAGLTGGALEDVSDDELKFTRNVNDQAPFVRIKGRTAYLGNGELGDGVLEIPKAKLSGLSWGRTQDAYTDLACNITAIGNDDGDLYYLTKRRNAAALPSTSDTTAPTVTLFPLDAATNVVLLATPATWTFNEAVQKNKYAFSVHRIVSTTDSAPVDGVVTFNDAGTVATFTPTGGWVASAKYQTNARGVRDIAGNVMDEVIGNFTANAT